MKKILITFLKGILAGLSIGLGGFLFIILSHFVSGELGKVLGSIFFAVGLFLVCTFGFYLYTGKIGLIFEGKKDKECKPIEHTDHGKELADRLAFHGLQIPHHVLARQ